MHETDITGSVGDCRQRDIKFQSEPLTGVVKTIILPNKSFPARCQFNSHTHSASTNCHYQLELVPEVLVLRNIVDMGM